MTMLSGKHEVEFMIAMDTDDETMCTDLMADYLAQIEPKPDSFIKLSWYWKEHKGKVHAINSCIPSKEFDIVTVLSDDIEPQETGYDDIIVQRMKESFPDLDGVIYFNDGRCRDRVVTIPHFGSAIYREIGHIVHPEFKAWGDDFTTPMLKTRGKLKYFPQVLLRHEWKKYAPVVEPDAKFIRERKMDATYMRAHKYRLEDARTAQRLILESKNGS
jgi:hypothetical protein